MRKLPPNLEFLVASVILATLWALAASLIALEASGAWRPLQQTPWLRVGIYALPVLGMHYLAYRYLRRTDEFIRALAAKRFIVTALVVLSASMIYGIAQMLASVPAISLYWVAPAFWTIFAFSGLFIRGSRIARAE